MIMFKFKTIFLIILLNFTVMAAHAGDYSDGWKIGWEQGWKKIRGPYSLAPLAPLSPLPAIGLDDFNAGFAAGVIAGAEAAH
jgi:hypothetical protein